MKFRMYAISLMAVNKSAEPLPGETKSYIEWAHRGAICLAESIEEAGQQSKEQVYRAYPVAKGYSLHSVVVTPIEESFFDMFQQSIDEGLFETKPATDEKIRTFNFDPDVVNDFHFDIGDGEIH